LEALLCESKDLFLFQLSLKPHLLPSCYKVRYNWLRVKPLQIVKIYVYIVNYVIKKTQLFIDLETVKLAVNLPYVEVVGENITVTDFVNLAHHFVSVVAETIDVNRCFLPLLGHGLFQRL